MISDIKVHIANILWAKTFKMKMKEKKECVIATLEIQCSRVSTISICSASHSGNKQSNPSPLPLSQHINQSHRCF